jgi:hypothetical protein
MRQNGKSAKATEMAEAPESVDEALARANADLRRRAKAKAAAKGSDQSLILKEAALKRAHDRANASQDKIRATGMRV